MDKTWKKAQSIVGTSPGRPDNDFYPTPEYATEALLNVERFSHHVWECACGDGAISKVLKRHSYNVLSTDLYDHDYGQVGVDFLMTHYNPNYPSPDIITNPPFKLAEKFILHAVKVHAVEKMALLMKLSALEGVRRSKILESTDLKRVHVFRKRLTMTRNGEPLRSGGMIAFAWFVWDKNAFNKFPTVDWI